MEPLKLTLLRKSIPVEMDGESYTLQELSGAERDRFMNSMKSRIRFNSEGKPSGIGDFEGLHASLLTLCLVDKEGKTVLPTLIQTWPSSTVGTLFEAAQKLNGLQVNKAEKGEPEENP